MVRLNRIYTRTGDGGDTRLVGGAVTQKDSLRIESYGTVDELNSIIGLARAFLRQSEAAEESKNELDDWLEGLQQVLFDLGCDLATPADGRWEGQPQVDSTHVLALEKLMDRLNKELPPLESFVLPGGGPVNAFLHQARTVCRRAERVAVQLSRSEEIGEFVISYLNRLSDALFVWSRWVTLKLDEPEVLWQPGSTVKE